MISHRSLSMASILFIGFLAIVSLPFCGCGRQRPATSSSTEGGGRVSEPAGGASLLAVPEPNLQGLEEPVQRQLREARTSLDALIGRGDTKSERLSEAYGRMGMLYQAYGLATPAEACYLDAKSLAPKDFRWSYYLGHLYRLQGESEKAAESYGTALSIDPSSLPATVLLAELELDRNRQDASERLFSRALALDGNCAAALVGLGRIEASRGRLSQAVDRFERAVAADPKACGIHYHLAIAYRRLGELDKAQEHLALLRREKDVKPRLPDPLTEAVYALRLGARPHQLAGAAAVRAGDFAKAAQEFREALAEAPNDLDARESFGTALWALGDRKAAMVQFVEASRMSPADSRAHYFIGLILALQGSDSEAIEQLREAIRLNPGFVDAELNLAKALQRRGLQADAVSRYEHVLENEPGNTDARMGLAFALIRLGRYSEARKRLEEDVDLFPSLPLFANALARLLAACPEDGLRDGARAVRLVRDAFSSKPEPAVAETMAMALAETGEYAQAARLQREWIERAAQSGQIGLAHRMQENLSLYEARRPCRKPWVEDHPLFSPHPLDVVAPVSTAS